jgi:hypothetical protein
MIEGEEEAYPEPVLRQLRKKGYDDVFETFWIQIHRNGRGRLSEQQRR